jgi:PIN domain nuclease of toxin-antitoxin system
LKARHFLLDTHTLLWATSAPENVSDTVQAVIANEANRLFISQATLWELSIKVTIGKLELPERYVDEIFGIGYESLPIDLKHLDAYRKLPLIHRDPFDRLLIAQSISEQLCLLSCDQAIQDYDVEWLW